MTEHFCKEHDTKFFKTPKMKTYAHPIGDTGKWCNMSEDTQPTATSPEAGEKAPSPPREPYKADPAKTSSIQSQVALKCAVELAVSGLIKIEEIISWTKAFEAFLNGMLVVKDDNIFRLALEHCKIKLKED